MRILELQSKDFVYGVFDKNAANSATVGLESDNSRVRFELDDDPASRGEDSALRLESV